MSQSRVFNVQSRQFAVLNTDATQRKILNFDTAVVRSDVSAMITAAAPPAVVPQSVITAPSDAGMISPTGFTYTNARLVTDSDNFATLNLTVSNTPNATDPVVFDITVPGKTGNFTVITDLKFYSVQGQDANGNVLYDLKVSPILSSRKLRVTYTPSAFPATVHTVWLRVSYGTA